MSSPFRQILIVGATGSIGSIILKALLNEPTFAVTALQRSSSQGRLPSSLKVITIDDSYPPEELEAAFSGQDVVINCITTLAVNDQLRFVDAAIAAKVRRYVPSEYGLNNNNPKARALTSAFRRKGEVQDYLRSKQSTGLEWMAIACGMWLKWSALNDFLGLHIKDKRFVMWDNGNGWFSTTTEENTALAVVNALTKNWDDTRNRIVWLTDFAVTQKILFEAVQRISGKEFTLEVINSADYIREKQAEEEAGDGDATYALIETGLVTGKFGGYLEKEGSIMNDFLGLPKRNLDEVVREALRAVEESDGLV